MMFDWKFNHLGMMVIDRDEILSHYQSIGLGVSVGPQPLLPYIEGEGEITFFRELEVTFMFTKLRGKKIFFHIRTYLQNFYLMKNFKHLMFEV